MKFFKVIHLPAFCDAYQTVLLENLKVFDIDVDYGKSFVFSSVVNLSILYNILKTPRFHIIHLHWQHPFLIADSRLGTMVKSLLFISQLYISKVLGKKVIWTIHNIVNHDKRHKELEIFFSKIIGRVADVIIAHCEVAKRDIQRIFGIKKKDKIMVIPHGAFHKFFKNNVSRVEARNRLNISSNEFIFLYLGQIRPYKGVLELIQSFKKLHSGNTKLIIAGKVRNEQLAERICKKADKNANIQLVLRSIPNDDMQIYMNAADILVLPYRDILTSGGVISGMSFGKAIISPHIGCIPEVLDRSGGFLYDPGEKDGLLNAMKRASTASRTKIREMGKYNLNAAKQLDWKDIATSTYGVYKNCLSG